jgi:alkanesulfonate monooxygenase SsuD/methylene tetrahydromethanopterin reductase-like flavin-dependent oxidoreductase (luciferase family)
VISSQRRSDYENYGFDELIDHGERCDRREEFIAVCKALWSSVDADAFLWDRLSGLVADPAKVRPINHVDRFFKVKGPLSVVPSPQGHPVLIQAGGPPRGIWAAAGFVDHVFGARRHLAAEAERLGAGKYLLDVEQAHLAQFVQVNVEPNVHECRDRTAAVRHCHRCTILLR